MRVYGPAQVSYRPMQISALLWQLLSAIQIQTPAREGDLARAALDLLGEDPAFAEPIGVMASQPGISGSRQRYVEPSTIALITAVLLVLQTRVKFKLDHNGKWSVEVDKKSSSDAAVKLLVQRLLSFLNK